MKMTQAQVDAHQLKHFGQAVEKLSPKLAEAREKDLHAAIIQECKNRGWICFHGSMAHSTFRTAGEPDFVILAPPEVVEITNPVISVRAYHQMERTFLIECKTAHGKLSPAQLAIHAWAEKLGHKIHVVRSMQDFLDVIDGKVEL